MEKKKRQHFTSQLEEGHVDVAKVLIQNGADVNAVEMNTKGRHFTSQLRMDMLTLRKCCFRTVRM